MIKFDTVTSFIASHVKASGYTAGEIISFEGYATKGDKGAARWKALGTVGTASVSPLTNNSPNLSDASGNEFELVGEGVIDLNVLGGTGVSYQNIADAASLTYSQGLTSNPNVSDRYIDATVAGMAGRVNPQVGEAYIVSDRANGIFDTVTVGTTPNVDLPNTYNIIVSTVDATKCFVLRELSKISLLQRGADPTGATDSYGAMQNALDQKGEQFWESGTFTPEQQLIIKSDTTLVLDKNCKINRAWAGTNGSRPDNSTIKNENAPLSAAIAVDPGPLVPSVWDDNIHISGGQWGHKDDDPATYRGTHVSLLAVTNSSFKSSQFNTQRSEWCTQFWGEDFNVDDIQINVAEGSTDVSNDGIHLIGGKSVTISNIRGGTDDDLVAIGSNGNLGIDGVTISNIAGITNANMVKVFQIRSGVTSAFGAPTEEVKNISVTNITGSAAAQRTGIFDVLIDGHTDYDLIKNVSFSKANVTYAGTHDASNTIGVDLSGGDGITFDDIKISGTPVRNIFTASNCNGLTINELRSVQPSKASAEVIELTTCDDVKIKGGSIAPTSSATAASAVRATDTTGLVMEGVKITEIQDGQAGLTLLGTSDASVSGGSIARKAGETTAKGVAIGAGATVSSLIVNGVNLSAVDTPIDKSPAPTYGAYSGNTGADASGAQASATDTSTVTHGLNGTPTIINVTGTVAGETVQVTATSSTTFTLAIKAADGSTAGTSQTVYWNAHLA